MEITDIKARLSILKVLAHYGLKPNRNKMINCPFHADKTPSMQVYPETNTVFCFSGNCKLHGKAMDAIEFIQQKEGITKHEAIKKAESFLNGTAITTKPATKQQTQPEPENYNELFIKLKTALHNSSKAKAYAEGRNIYDAKLEIGYNNGREFKHLKNCMVFPLKDRQNNIVSLYGRNIESKGHDDRHYYTVNRKGLYPGYPNQETVTIILTESIIDAATLQRFTEYNILALFGTNALTEEHKAALQELPSLKEIIFFLNGDTAGKEATVRHSETLHQLLPNITISAVETPENEDINSLVISHEPEILEHLVNERQILFSSNETSIEEKREPETEELPSITTQGLLNTKNPDYIIFEYEVLLISIIGGIALYPLDRLKITLKIQLKNSQNPLHSIRQSGLDLYSEEQLQRFARSASEKLETSHKTLSYAIAELTSLLEDYRNQRIEQQKPKTEKPKVLTESRKQELLKLLRKPNLMHHINELIGQTGMVGEEKNRLILWTVYTSRLTDNPLHVICLGASGTGKTYLQEKIGELIPKHHKVSFTASTENALYYVGKTDLKHKLILIEDMDGASSILYVLRELQTKGYVSKLVPLKDSKGNMKTIQLEVEGPICLSGTTTREKLYEDNANRCLLIYLDNSGAQQNSIMDYQRKNHAGTINKTTEEATKELLQDMQLMFRKIRIVNPYAEKLIIPETVFKPLRTNAHYLQFIEAITFVHQYQREIKTDAQGNPYILTTLEDIELANELLKDVLLAKSDELTKACRDFLEELKAMLQKEKKQSFFRSDVRNWTRINPDNLRYYLSQLNKYGYIRIVGGNKHKTGFEYEITDRDEYTRLTSNVQTALDKALQAIKETESKKQLRTLLTVANGAN